MMSQNKYPEQTKAYKKLLDSYIDNNIPQLKEQMMENLNAQYKAIPFKMNISDPNDNVNAPILFKKYEDNLEGLKDRLDNIESKIEEINSHSYSYVHNTHHYLFDNFIQESSIYALKKGCISNEAIPVKDELFSFFSMKMNEHPAFSLQRLNSISDHPKMDTLSFHDCYKVLENASFISIENKKFICDIMSEHEKAIFMLSNRKELSYFREYRSLDTSTDSFENSLNSFDTSKEILESAIDPKDRLLLNGSKDVD